MPTNFVDVDMDEMEYVEGGGYLKLVASESAIRDIATAGTSVLGGLIGFAIGGYFGWKAGQAIASIIGGGVGWIVGGIVARGNVHGDYVLYDGWIPGWDLGRVYLP